ncbi:hypothetical protein V1477_002129 [Vespula maculifrons]|uniref:Uncharacterized protein n=1 Tax=Vespula maculifrons TaxID=7453 RepID=A0ABD2CY39_VESMC
MRLRKLILKTVRKRTYSSYGKRSLLSDHPAFMLNSTREKPATRCCISGISISISYSSSSSGGGGTSSSSGSNGIIVSNVRFQTNIRRFEKDKLLRT